jgi:hypothetical protein
MLAETTIARFPVPFLDVFILAQLLTCSTDSAYEKKDNAELTPRYSTIFHKASLKARFA